MYIYIAKGAESEDYLPSHMIIPSNIDKSKTTSAKKIKIKMRTLQRDCFPKKKKL
jgi:hypothetical protein